MIRILFIVNPRSELRRGVKLEKIIRKELDLARFEYAIRYSRYHRHAYKLAYKEKGNYQLIIAAGGDGTVNQVAEGLAGSGTTIGIIPLGSGNGLAYDLGIPRKIPASVRRINSMNKRTIDSARIGDRFFINMAGIGFDAEIAHDFDGRDKRGLRAYVLCVFRKFFAYKLPSCTLRFKDQVHELSPFIMSFANSGQYGNNAYIAPGARADDGFLDISVLDKFPLYLAPVLAARLFLKNIHRSRYYKVFRVEKASISAGDKLYGHIDGEAVLFDKTFDIVAQPQSFEIIV